MGKVGEQGFASQGGVLLLKLAKSGYHGLDGKAQNIINDAVCLFLLLLWLDLLRFIEQTRQCGANETRNFSSCKSDPNQTLCHSSSEKNVTGYKVWKRNVNSRTYG